jgi:predicted ATPase/DNA-binding NarL/FixJ family response regulator
MDLDLIYNLPAPATSFLGREAELNDLARLLVEPGVRLLTIWGPGGIGKTRLAIAAAAQNARRFADGVVFVRLQPVSSTQGIAGAIAEALAIPLTGAADPYDQVLRALREKQQLLVLDNTEHLGDGIEAFSRLLAAAPGLTLLVTSREALRLREEWLFPLSGLPVPDSASDAGADADALRLFFERARQARHNPVLETERAAAIEICRLVEGLPLAIELAAAWTRSLSCAAIAAEIQRNLDFLTTGLRNFPERHRSLRAVCDQSWALLTAQEQQVFARLAVIRAGFSAEAAAAVAGANLAMLDALVGKSIIRHAAGDRYQIHELLRQYAEERLHENADEVARTATALGQFYAAFLSRWFPGRAGQIMPSEALAAIALEIENIRVAWPDILAQTDGEALRRVMHVILDFSFMRGPYREGAALIEQALERLRALPATAERQVAIADCLHALGLLRLRAGQIGEARQLFADSAAIADPLALPRSIGDSTEPLAGLGLVALVAGDYREAVRLGMAALQRGEAEQHGGNQRDGLYVLVSAALAQGQYRIARRYAQRVYALVQELGNRWFLAYCHIALGHIASGRGAYAEARRHYEAAYLLREEFADPEGMALALAAQAKAALLEGNPIQSGYLYERSLAIYRYVGDQGGLAAALDGLGRAHIALGKYVAAREALARALRIATEMAYTPLQLSALISVAELLLVTGDQVEDLPIIRLVARHPAADREATQRVHTLLLSSPARSEAPRLVAGQDEEIAAVVAGVLQRLSVLEPADAPSVQRDAPAQALVEPLSEREREILGHIATGRSNQEIAERLIFSVGTIKWYTTQIYGKLGVKSRTQAIARARELGLLG